LALALVPVCALLASVNLGGRGRDEALEPLDPSLLTRPRELNGHLTVWGWNVAAKSLRSVTPAFRERHPNVSVDVVMSGANVQMRFLLSLASGTGAPDVMQLQSYESARYIATGRMVDLTPVAAKYKDQFAPAAWANCVHDGKVYAIPWDLGPCAVFYKPHLFARYGIDPARIETWDDYIEAGREILRKSGGRTKMLALTPHWLQHPYELLLQQVNGQVFDEAGRVVIDSPASRRVLDLLRRMLDAGICAQVAPYTQEWMAGFNADTIATYPGAVWMGGTIKDTTGQYDATSGPWRVFPLPAFDRGGVRTSNMGGSVLVIPEQCPDKEAAWAFIEHGLCTRESQVAQYVNFDLFPAFLPALDDPAFAEPDPFYDGQKVRQVFAAGVRDIPALHRTPDWSESATYVNQALDSWAKDREDTGEMLRALADKLGRRLGREVVR
jgi:lactose/L-arabinose transport system substrate-binding protein